MFLLINHDIKIPINSMLSKNVLKTIVKTKNAFFQTKTNREKFYFIVSIVTWGEGGLKSPKSCLRILWMPPNYKLQLQA